MAIYNRGARWLIHYRMRRLQRLANALLEEHS